MDYHKMKRTWASLMVGFVCLLTASMISLSGNLLRTVKFGERSLLDLMDQVAVNWIIPVVGLAISLFISRRIPHSQLKSQFINEKNLVTIRLYPTWLFALKYVVPTLIMVILLVQGFILFKN
jgi:SNF family Na+-dependent transporter